MKELGSYLRRTRLENGVNLEEAAEDMNIPVFQLENIENGNTRAFKDVYKLKQYIKFYAKYLGLNPEKVIDQFNDFLFEHTSKISLDDIKKAHEKIKKEEKSKIKSPYTIEHKSKKNIMPIIVPIVTLILILLLIVIIIIGNIPKSLPRTNELKCDNIKLYSL